MQLQNTLLFGFWFFNCFISINAGSEEDRRPHILRSVSTPSLLYADVKNCEFTRDELDVIVFRICDNDKVLFWSGYVQYRDGYESPHKGEDIIEYWTQYDLADTIECYRVAKSTRKSQRIGRKVANQNYVWYFTPNSQDHLNFVSGYVINVDFMHQTLAEAEKKYEDAQMMQNALTSHQTRYQCYNILMCLQSVQDTIPMLKKTRLTNILSQEGQVLQHNDLCDGMLEDVVKAQHFTSVLLKRQQQCEDVIACQHQTMKLDKKTFDVVDMVKTLWKDLYVDAKKKDIKFCLQIESSTPDRFPFIKQDEFRLKQVFSTIIENAINYTPDAGIIHIALELQKYQIVFRVADSGIGIGDDVLMSHQQKMKLGQLSFSQPKPNAGLGCSLAIAQHVVSLMEGQLEIMTGTSSSDTSSIDSVHNTGSTSHSASSFDFDIGTIMIVSLPCRYDAVESFYSENPDSIHLNRISRPKLNHASRFAIQKRETILVVDDDPVIRKLWSKALEQLGYVHHMSEDGDDATKYYEAHHTSVALIVMDIQMPHNGIDATKKIRSVEEKMDLPFRVSIVANTASGSSDALRLECRKAGMTEFMTKPNNKRDIKRIIETQANIT